ncbi:MAG: hypothetical protein WC340_02775 [Kiritimatiellia bacterium]
MKFKIQTGEVNVGWCDFSVQLGDEVWSCCASYIGSHPLLPLISSVVEIYDDGYATPTWAGCEPKICNTVIHDEPGGLIIKAIPTNNIHNDLRIQIFKFSDEITIPESEDPYDILPVAEGLVDFWDYAESILEDASRTLVHHGFLGLLRSWEHVALEDYSLLPIFPVEHFIYLAMLVKHRSSRFEITFKDEISLLQELEQKYGANKANTQSQ